MTRALRALLFSFAALVMSTLAASLMAQSPAPATPAANAPPPQAPGANPAPSAVQSPPAVPRIIGTMSELMIEVIYPASDAILYIGTRTPTNDVEWNALQAQALMLAESANLLMMPGRARDQDRWMQDAKLMLDAGAAAFKAAKARDVAALEALNDQVYVSCTTCHMHYRRNYGRGATTATPTPPRP